MMAFANLVVWLVAIYSFIGLLFGLFFVTWGVSYIDQSARGAGVGFRLIILPGVISLWPLMARRWLRGMKWRPIESNAHRAFASKEPRVR